MEFQSTRPSRGATWTTPIGGLSRENFNPRAPRGARRYFERGGAARRKFQSTRPSRGATDYYWPVFANIGISIHAPLAGRDLFRHRQHCELQDFNPRAPRGARPLNSMGQQLKTLDFNPRAPRGARRNGAADRGRQCAISIHAPLAGRDRDDKGGYYWEEVISIHAPLAGRDWRNFQIGGPR